MLSILYTYTGGSLTVSWLNLIRIVCQKHSSHVSSYTNNSVATGCLCVCVFLCALSTHGNSHIFISEEQYYCQLALTAVIRMNPHNKIKITTRYYNAFTIYYRVFSSSTYKTYFACQLEYRAVTAEYFMFTQILCTFRDCYYHSTCCWCCC